ncbi:hypothetical protein CPB85DRAFT_1255334 [Mucidula mucida]|nr:hypothetical protein CPB85DRAFT_1255334 [Mucidula mucida]
MHLTAAILESAFTSVSMLRWDDVLALLADNVEIVVKPRTLGFPIMGKEQFLREMKADVAYDRSVSLVTTEQYTLEEVYELKGDASCVVVRFAIGNIWNIAGELRRQRQRARDQMEIPKSNLIRPSTSKSEWIHFPSIDWYCFGPHMAKAMNGFRGSLPISTKGSTVRKRTGIRGPQRARISTQRGSHNLRRDLRNG